MKKRTTPLALFFFVLCLSLCAHADTGIITLNLARSRIIDLPEPAGTILIANPAAVNVTLDQPQRLILMPLQPTATHMTILNRQGGIIQEATIMVSPRRERAIVIDRHCTGTDVCPASSTHYCTDDECVDLGMRGNAVLPHPSAAPATSTIPEVAPDQLNRSGFSPPAGLPLPHQEQLP